MPIPLWAARHLNVDATRLRAQGVNCPYSTGNVVVLSAMRDAADDLFLERARLPVQQVTVLAPTDGWDRSAIELPPYLKKLRSGKLDRVIVAFESATHATLSVGGRFAWSKR